MQWLMLQQEETEDYVIAAGTQHSVRDFVTAAANTLKIEIEWEGKGVNEKGYDKSTGTYIVKVDPRYFRPTEVDTLLGDPSKGREKLGWVPKTSFQELVQEMVEKDVELAQRDALCEQEGFNTYKHHE